MHTSLYMGGTYQDADLNTIKGRDAELAAVALRYREEYMDMWRTDKYNAPTQPMPDTFAGVTNFLYIMDTLFGMFPGFRYENCANNVVLPTLDSCRKRSSNGSCSSCNQARMVVISRASRCNADSRL
jgi:hypothetical protein